MSAELRVLLVEDEPVDAMTVKRAAQKRCLPIQIEVVESAEAALARLFAASTVSGGPPLRPDLILADLRLPQLSGLDLMSRVKEDVRLRRIPFVMLSTSSQEFEVSRAYDLGATGYFVKPISFEEYADIIEQVVRFCLKAERPAGWSSDEELDALEDWEAWED